MRQLNIAKNNGIEVLTYGIIMKEDMYHYEVQSVQYMHNSLCLFFLTPSCQAYAYTAYVAEWWWALTPCCHTYKYSEHHRFVLQAHSIAHLQHCDLGVTNSSQSPFTIGNRWDGLLIM